MRRHIKFLIITVIALATLTLTLMDQTHFTLEKPSAPLSSSIAPDVAFTLLSGGNVTLHAFKGHTLWLHFWASWCIPCRDEFPHLLSRVQKDPTIILLAVSGDAKAEDARKFIAPLQSKFSNLFDNGQVIIAHDPDHKIIEGIFQTYLYPETIIINQDLVMTRKVIGIYK